MPWLTGWESGYRRKITVPASKVDSNLTWFPILLKLSDSAGISSDDITSIFDEIGSNSKKIAITKADGTTQISCEIERWDSVGEEAWLWVSKSDLVLSSSGDTDLYLYYDSTHADNTVYIGDTKGSTPVTNVWDNDYGSVWHLDETTGGTGAIKDSIGNDDGTDLNSPTLDSEGQMDGSIEFNSGDSEAIELDGSGYLSGAFTVKMWVNPQSGVLQYQRALTFGPDDNSTRSFLVVWITGVPTNPELQGLTGTGAVPTEDVANVGGELSQSTWTLWEWTFDGTSTHKLYINGVDTNSTGLGTGLGLTGATYIACRNLGSYFDGIIDEVTISNTDRNAAWCQAEFYNDTDDFVEWGTQEASTNYKLEGKTFDKDGDALGTCKCLLLKDNQDDTASVVDYTTSDGGGDYSFENIGDNDAQYQVYAWKDDSPHVMDVTDHDLLPKETPDASYDLYLRSDVDKGETSPDKDLRLRADEDKIGDITGTSVIVVEEITVSGAGLQVFDGTSVITLDGISVSAGGSLGYIGQSVIILDEITISASGLYEFIATSAIVLDEITISASGLYEFIATSVITLDEITVASVGEQENRATSDIVLDGVEVSGTGIYGDDIDGSSVIILDEITISSAGLYEFIGSSVITLDEITISASGTCCFVGSSVIILDEITISSAGLLEVIGSSVITLDEITISSAGLYEFIATSVIVLEEITVASAGLYEFIATSVITLDEITIASAGIQEFIGSSVITLNEITIVSTGQVGEEITGTSVIILDEITISSAGLYEFIGSSVITLDEITISASGLLEVIGSSVITLEEITVSGAGQVEGDIIGTSVIILDEITVASAGLYEFIGSSVITLDEITVTSTGQVGADITGVGNIIIEQVTITSNGEQEIIATSDIILEETEVSASGDMIVIGTSIITIGETQVSGAGIILPSIIGTSNIILDELVIASIGIQVNEGSSDIQLDEITIDGEGISYADVLGVAVIILDPVEVYGEGYPGAYQIVFSVGIGSSFMTGEYEFTKVELNEFKEQMKKDIDDGFLNEEDFGEKILYDYNDGEAPQEIAAIVDDEYFLADPGSEIGVMSSQPCIMVASNKFKIKPDEGHTMIIRGRRFKVMREEPDGTGISTIFYHFLK